MSGVFFWKKGTSLRDVTQLSCVSGPDTNFDINDIKWIPGALDAVDKLKNWYDLYILSFCGKKTEMETRIALRHKIANTIPEDKWIFTRKREHKVDQMKLHGISTLIDDTEQIINWVTNANLKGIHFRGKRFPTWQTVVSYLKPKPEKVPNVTSHIDFPSLC